MTIGFELWPVSDRQRDRITKSTDQYTSKIFDFASNKQTNKKTTFCNARYLQNPGNKFDLKNNWWLNSMTKYENPLQFSSQSVTILYWQFLTILILFWQIDNFRNLVHVDLLVFVYLLAHIVPKKNYVVEFSDVMYSCSSNFKLSGWILRILEMRPMLTSKIAGDWRIQWPDI